jgi:lysophospholipase L1-like esterase
VKLSEFAHFTRSGAHVLLAGALVAPVAAVVYAMRKAQAEPASSLRQFVSTPRADVKSKVVVCLGASLVHGRIGASFVDHLIERLGAEGFAFVNAGRNGDLAYNALGRLDQIIAVDPDVVLVLLGSNDLMASLGVRRSIGYRLFKRLPARPTIAWFRENLATVAKTLRARTRARIALCSLPTLGERVDAQVNLHLADYNAVIAEVARETGAAYVPVHERLDEFLERSNHASGPEFGAAMRRMLAAVVSHYVFGNRWDDIASSHGYAIFIDGIHVSERGADVIASTVEDFLRSEFEPRPKVTSV